MPQISVITPSFNCERFIDNCIKNVIDQNCPEAEHLIVDGGSTDGTVEVIRHYAQNYPHIRWISEPDQGQSDAMNKGIAMARGDILGFLNVDDFYEPNVLNRVLTIFETLPNPSLLVGNCKVWDNEENLLFVNKPKKFKFTDLLMGTDINPHPINPSAYFYHKSIHQEIGLYDTDEHYALDLDFLLRAVQVAKLRYMDEHWGNFNMVAGSKSVEDGKTYEGVQRAPKMIKEYRDTLPLYKKLWLSLMVALFNIPFLTPMFYFSKYPDELPWRLKARLLNIFRLKQ